MAIKIKGLQQLTKDLRNFGQEGDRIVKFEIETAATNIERGAIQKVPFQLSGVPLGIKQRINKVIENGGFSAKVGVEGQDPFPAYLEFGCGSNFTDLVSQKSDLYDSSILELASQFKKTGEGTLPARPYLFPSFFTERPELIKRLKSELEKLSKSV